MDETTLRKIIREEIEQATGRTTVQLKDYFQRNII